MKSFKLCGQRWVVNVFGQKSLDHYLLILFIFIFVSLLLCISILSIDPSWASPSVAHTLSTQKQLNQAMAIITCDNKTFC